MSLRTAQLEVVATEAQIPPRIVFGAKERKNLAFFPKRM